MNIRIESIICLFAGTLFMAASAFSQENTRSYPNPGGKKRVEIVAQNSELIVEGYNGNEVVIESLKKVEYPERAKGLRPLHGGASDNTGLGLQVKESADKIEILKAMGSDGEYLIKVPFNTPLKVTEANMMGSEDFTIKNVKGEIEVVTMISDISLQNVSGPVVATTTTGDIKITFDQLSQSQPSSFTTVGGDVDISMPASSKANFEIKTMTGEVFTDLDIKTKGQEEGMRMLGGRMINGTLNGGGVDITLNCISGDVYLRKK
ncbi:MAG: DUF4097 family beta strand repeat-containing protein [Saprospiraceae bacterium]|nr:DUF4097 family beta strand repeat-containing protein [Saprospiraceae bacterium]